MIGEMACIVYFGWGGGVFDLAPIKLACEVHRAEIAWHQMLCPRSKRFLIYNITIILWRVTCSSSKVEDYETLGGKKGGTS